PRPLGRRAGRKGRKRRQKRTSALESRTTTRVGTQTMTTLARRFLGSSAAIVALGLVIPTACTTSRRDYGDPDPDGSAGASSGGAESSGGAATGGAASGGAPAGGGGGSSGETGGQGGEMNVEVEPTSCTKDEDCLSGSCRLSYRDKDGDGYGTNDDVTGRCDGTIPAGYTAFGGRSEEHTSELQSRE